MTHEQLSRIEHDTASMRDVLATRRRSAEAWRQHLAQQQGKDRPRPVAGVFYVLRGIAAFLVLAASSLWITILLITGGLQ